MLRDARGQVWADNLDGCTYWPLFNDTHRCYKLHWIRLLLVKEINIPGIEIQGTIFIDDKLVARLLRGKNVTFCTHIVEPADLSLRIDVEVIVLVLQDDCFFISIASATSR